MIASFRLKLGDLTLKILAAIASSLLLVGLAAPAVPQTRLNFKETALSAFIGSSTKLTAQQRNQVAATIRTNPEASELSCSGFISRTSSAAVRNRAMLRAKAACDYAKQLKPSLITSAKTQVVTAAKSVGRVALSLQVKGPIVRVGATCPTPGAKAESSSGLVMCTLLWHENRWSYQLVRGTGIFPGQTNLEQLPVEQCKIKDQRPLEARVGGSTSFPLVGDRVPAQGELTVAIIPIDYPDAPARKSPQSYIGKTLKEIDAWTKFFTENKVRYKWVVLDKWVRMPKESKYYVEDKSFVSDGNILTNTNKQLQSKEDMIYQVFSEAEKVLDLDSIDAAWVLSNPEAKLVDFPPGYANDQKVKTATKTYDLSFWSIGTYTFGNLPEKSHGRPLWSTMLHELGHAHGLAGHAPGNEWTLDHMTAGGVLNAWNGWLTGWIPDKEFVCLNGTKPGKHRVVLDSVDLNLGGPVAAVVRLSDHEVLVVESRKKGPFSIDQMTGFNAVTATYIDSTKLAERYDGNINKEKLYFSYYVRIENPKRKFVPGTIAPDTNIFAYLGDTLVHENVRIKVLNNKGFDTVEIEVKAR